MRLELGSMKRRMTVNLLYFWSRHYLSIYTLVTNIKGKDWRLFQSCISISTKERRRKPFRFNLVITVFMLSERRSVVNGTSYMYIRKYSNMLDFFNAFSNYWFVLFFHSTITAASLYMYTCKPVTLQPLFILEALS